jgi:hypothetical protein
MAPAFYSATQGGATSQGDRHQFPGPEYNGCMKVNPFCIHLYSKSLIK